MNNILFIHGAWCSIESFNYIKLKTQIESLQHCNFWGQDYNCQIFNLNKIIEQQTAYIDTIPADKIDIISHSMGGVVAFHLINHPKVRKILTIASPINGIDIAAPFRYYVWGRAPILRNLAPNARMIRSIRKEYNKDIHMIVTHSGFHPFMMVDSDGVVTVESQSSWVPDNAKVKMISKSHNEVLQSDELSNYINGDYLNV